MFGKRKSDGPAPAPLKPQPAGTLPLIEDKDNAPVETEIVETDIQAAPEETNPADAPLPPSLKESPMARSPFAPPPVPTSPLPPASPLPAARPAALAGAQARPESADRRTLVVGRGISVQGTVQDAERLVVEGTVEATSINGLIELSIAQGGVFKGEVEVEEAEIAGTIDGTVIARQTLIVRSTGRVLGTARCRRLQVEDGGQITGRIEMLTETSKAGEG